MNKSLLHFFVKLSLVALMLCASSSVKAALLVYEGFDYTNGTTIAGQSGGVGWTNAWATGSAGNLMGTNTAGSLNYTDVNGLSLQTGGGSLVVGNPAGAANTTAQPNRAMPLNLSGGGGTTAGAGGTMWISFLYKRLNFDLGTLPYLRQANLGLFEGGGERVAIGGPNTSATVLNVMSAWGNGTPPAVPHPGAAPFQAVAYPITPDSTYFILVKTVTDNTNLTPDTAYIWFNWTNLTVEPNIATADIVENEMNLSGVNTVRFQAGNTNASGSNAVFQVDELRVGGSFADVTPTGTNALPPTITSQPASKTATQGESATFNVSAAGGFPFSYQWYFDTNTPLAGRTNSALVITNVQNGDAGGYSVVVTNSAGAATSAVAMLTVVPPFPPVITNEPISREAIIGGSAVFNVSATGTSPLRYQWYFNITAPVAGQTNTSLSITNVQTNSAGNYSVVITNNYGSVTSIQAALTVIPPFELLPAFPGADGAAKFVTGGRGGIVYHVTKLDTNFSDSGAGGLRYGLTDGNFPAGVPRTIVFDVGGVFWLGRYGAESNHNNGWNAGQSRYNLSGNTTIAGQTAPGPVIIMGGVTKAGGVNTIIRNVMFAPGYGMQGFHEPPNSPTPGDFPDSYVYDALDISGQNIMMDHLTAIYSTDEAISCNELAAGLTVQYCNISQGQNYPQADAESSGVNFTGHALAQLLQAGSNAKVSALNNLYAHQKGRLPRVGSEVGTGAFNDFRNNVFYNWLGTGGSGAGGQPSFNNFINNFHLAGPGGDNPSGGLNSNIVNVAGGTSIFSGSDSSLTRIFHSGNLKDTNKDGDPNDTTALANGDYGSSAFQSTAYDVNIGVTLSAQGAFTNVLRYVGSRWWERPYDFTLGNFGDIVTNNIAAYVDERLIGETFTGSGRIIAWADDPFNSDPNEGVEWRSLLALRADTITGAAPFSRAANWDTDQDGMPDYWELEHGLNPNLADNNGDFDNDGYSNLEEYLNDIAAWPAPGNIFFTGSTNNRFAQIFNWQVSGVVVNISGSNVTTSSRWQPSRYDTAIISNATVVVDAVGQHAGNLRLRNSATLNITNGWLDVSNTLEIATAGTAAINLSGGRLRVGMLTNGIGSSTFNFTGGTLSADVVGFDLVNKGGVIAPGKGVGQMYVFGILTFQPGSSVLMELGATNFGQSDAIIIEGNLNLGGTLNVTDLAGFGAGTYVLFTYDGFLTGSMAIGSMPSGYNYVIDTSVVGEIRLVVTQPSGGGDPPSFGSVKFAGGSIIMSGTGPTNSAYRVLTSTNVALPLNLWTPIATNTFSAAGQFSITNPVNAGKPQTFYLLRSP